MRRQLNFSPVLCYKLILKYIYIYIKDVHLLKLVRQFCEKKKESVKFSE